MLTVASGERSYSFRNSLIFMTSNLAAREIQGYDQRRKGWLGWLLPSTAASRHRAVEKLVRARLLKAFAPEFVNRIDNIITFNWIERGLVEQLVALEVQRLNRRLEKHRCSLVATPQVLAHVARAGFDRQFGARALRRSVRQHLEVPLAEFLLEYHAPVMGEPPVVYAAHMAQGRIGFSRQ